jgi:hypothetical protein
MHSAGIRPIRSKSHKQLKKKFVIKNENQLQFFNHRKTANVGWGEVVSC